MSLLSDMITVLTNRSSGLAFPLSLFLFLSFLFCRSGQAEVRERGEEEGAEEAERRGYVDAAWDQPEASGDRGCKMQSYSFRVVLCCQSAAFYDDVTPLYFEHCCLWQHYETFIFIFTSITLSLDCLKKKRNEFSLSLLKDTHVWGQLCKI